MNGELKRAQNLIWLSKWSELTPKQRSKFKNLLSESRCQNFICYEKSITINTETFESGIYFIEIKEGEKIHVEKIII